jgi:hypothetical protein
MSKRMKTKTKSKELHYNNDMTNRFDKLEWLKENCTEKHMKEMFLTELVGWLSEYDFNEFFEHHCRLWSIETPFDEDEDPNEFIIQDDEMVPVSSQSEWKEL